MTNVTLGQLPAALAQITDQPIPHYNTLLRWAKSGKFPAEVTAGRRYSADSEQVAALLQRTAEPEDGTVRLSALPRAIAERTGKAPIRYAILWRWAVEGIIPAEVSRSGRWRADPEAVISALKQMTAA